MAKIGTDKLAKNTQNAQIVCQSPKVWNFDEKRRHWAIGVCVQKVFILWLKLSNSSFHIPMCSFLITFWRPLLWSFNIPKKKLPLAICFIIFEPKPVFWSVVHCPPEIRSFAKMMVGNGNICESHKPRNSPFGDFSKSEQKTHN